ncbi:MAG: Crp/Fnr family transcriptional regulator [Candidatus Izemoplasmatales bacterium]|nr:Crp/Fnr family transcriptional regulator [Candidatus Izemoplasmatales bacterium]
MNRFCKNCHYDYLEGEIIREKENNILFFADDKLDYIYQINEGYVKMVRYLENGDEKIIGILGPGDYLALLAVLQKKTTYLATAITLTKTTLKKIPEDQIWNAYQKNPDFRDRCLTCAVTRSNLFQNFLVQSANLDVKERVMNTLKILFEKFGYRIGEKQVLDLPFSKTVLANIIGIRRETLSRTITSLEQENILKNDKNRYLLKYKIL